MFPIFKDSKLFYLTPVHQISFAGIVLTREKKKQKTNKKKQVYQVIDEALLGKGFQDTGYLGKKLTGNTKFRGKINGGEHV